MVVRSPLVQAEQDGPVRINYLTKVGMSRLRLRLAKQRLVPPEARRHVAHSDDGPDAFHKDGLIYFTTNLNGLSIVAGIPPDTLRSLNPVLVRGMTPPGSPYELKVPAGSGRGVLAALAGPRPKPARVAVASVQGNRSVHVVRPRDTVSEIARHYGVSIDDVMRWNRLSSPGRIRPGDRLEVADHTSAASK